MSSKFGIKRVLIMLLSLIIVLSVSACGNNNKKQADQPKEKTHLNIGFLNVMDDAQVMLAYDAKMFENHGLDVDLQQFKSGTDLVKSIVNGQLDAGVLGFTNAVSWAAKGSGLKVVGGAQMGYHSMLVRADSGIKSIADLKGKAIASQKQGSTADIVLNGVVFKNAGLTRDDVNMQYVDPAISIQSLAAGKVDAAFVFQPYEAIATATMNAKKIYEVGDVWPFPCMVVITSEQKLSSDRDAINAMLDAQKEAIDMLTNDPDKAASYLAKRFIPEGKLQDENGKEYDAVKLISDAAAAQTFNWQITPDQEKRMQEVADMMLDQGIIKEKLDVKSILDLTWQNAQK
ncbi:MAG TPA: ABC transporter substrate-binding protein [Bacilli bacterium]